MSGVETMKEREEEERRMCHGVGGLDGPGCMSSLGKSWQDLSRSY